MKKSQISLILPLFFLLFSCTQANQQIDQSIIREKKIYTDFSKSPEGKYIEKGDKYLNEKKYDEALKEYNEALKIDSKSPIVYNKIGDYYLIKGNLKESENNYNKSLDLDSKNTKPYLSLFLIYSEQNDLDKLTNLITKLFSLKDDSTINQRQVTFIANLCAIKIAILKKDYKNAEKVSTLFVENVPNLYLGYRYLGEIYFLQNNGELGLKNYLKAIELGDNSIFTYISVGFYYYQSNNYDTSIKYLSEANLINENYISNSLLGEIFYKKNDYEKSIEYYSKAISLPVSEKTLSYIGVAKSYEKQNKIKEATINYQKACDLGDQDSCKWIKG